MIWLRRFCIAAQLPLLKDLALLFHPINSPVVADYNRLASAPTPSHPKILLEEITVAPKNECPEFLP
jgi:hypothetical protein